MAIRPSAALVIAIATLLSVSAAASGKTPIYKDPSAPVDQRVEDLLGQMTLDEKIAQLGCLWSTALVSGGSFDPAFAAAKMPHGMGQVTRIGASTGLRPRESAEFMNAIQHVVV